MNDLKAPEGILKEITDEEINIEEDVSLLIQHLQENEENTVLYDLKEIFNQSNKKFHGILNIISNLLDWNQNPITRYTIAKVIIVCFSEEGETLLKGLIEKESSVIMLTQLFNFLRTQTSYISQKLKSVLIKKYKSTYNITLEESEFLIELEASQTNPVKGLDINFGYFKKFETNDINILKNTNYYNYVVNNNHIYALDFSRWEFEVIPDSIGSLSELKFLNLSNLKLNKLPDSMEDLTNLEYLNLNGNEIKDIPEWLLRFSRKNYSEKYIAEGVVTSEAYILALIEVFSGEKLEQAGLKADVIQWEAAFHYKVNSNGNVIGIYIKKENIKLGILPEQICNLKLLEELEVSESSVVSIPDCIGNLRYLRYLDLSYNMIKEIPESINNLSNLENLHLNDNDFAKSILYDLRWNKIGQSFLDNGEFSKTIDECKETLEIYPRNKFALFHLALAFREVGETKLAKRAYEQFLKIDPLSSVVWSCLSDIYHHDGEFEKALLALKNAIEIEPTIALLWSNLGLNYKKLGKYKEAIKSYLISLDLDPNNKYVWRDLASIYRDKGDYLKAIEADERALDLELNSKEDTDY
ncbi:MAG: tetratricopeptide repeat protein [Promethearchaeota archaeon]